jgi:hypothetical protein
MNARPGWRPGLAEHRDEIVDRMAAGEPFGVVEEAIELADVTEDQKAALWLLAFSMRDRHDQRRDAEAYFASVDGK